tara:strand:+ start:648 stop:824 length:177 start_codon:yes stop_codon:yes gene_type:complete
MAKQIANKTARYKTRASISSPKHMPIQSKTKSSKGRDDYIVECNGHFVWKVSSKSEKI